MDTFDVAVIGSGPGGYVAAIRSAQLGLKTALIEKDPRLGGTCLNVGCIPSKALLESSELFYAAANNFSTHGILVEKAGLDLGKMMSRKDRIVKELTDGIGLLMKKNKIAVIPGMGSLSGPGRVRIDGGGESRDIEAKSVILAMGSVPVELPFMKFDGSNIITSTEALSFEKVPERLLVVGAGAIGLEMGSVWNRLGSEVTVVEMLPRVAPFADKQMSTVLQRALESQGMTFHLKSKVKGAQPEGDGLSVTFETEKGETRTVSCDKVLVAVGRRPLTDGAGLKEMHVTLDEQRRIEVDDRYRTNVPGVYAIGDLIRGPMLAHKASEEGVAAAEIIAGKPGHVNYNAVPNVVYTWPELAQVGLTEAEAKEKGLPVKSGRFYFKANGRAKSLGDEEGLVKVVANADTDRVLGVHIVGPRASDMIAEAVSVMEFAGSAEDVGRTIHAHPTLSEVVKEAALAVDRKAIHG